MNDPAAPQFEVHGREVLDRAKSILSATESPRAWAQIVIEAIGNLKDVSPNSPNIRHLETLVDNIRGVWDACQHPCEPEALANNSAFDIHIDCLS